MGWEEECIRRARIQLSHKALLGTLGCGEGMEGCVPTTTLAATIFRLWVE